MQFSCTTDAIWLHLFPMSKVSRLPLLRDLAEGLQQQMYFWGQDVVRPGGNFLVTQGFARSPSPSQKGTSCYSRDWEGGQVELYGSRAGWYDSQGGFAFIRPLRKCAIWTSGEARPTPGNERRDLIDRTASARDVYEAARPFLRWLITYEEAVLGEFGPAYRRANYKKYKQVPKARPWVEPDAALAWFRHIADNPTCAGRPPLFSQKRSVLSA